MIATLPAMPASPASPPERLAPMPPTPTPRSALVAFLEERRLRLGLSQEAFAVYLSEHGVPTTPSRYSRILSRQRLPQEEWLRPLAQLWPEVAALAAADLLTRTATEKSTTPAPVEEDAGAC